MIYTSSNFKNHESINFFCDPISGLKAIIAVHSTALGPALGGCRFVEYANEEEALVDVLKLSESMTYKNAISDLSFGGGKMVVLKNTAANLSRTEIFKKIAQFIKKLNGHYITGIDSGTTFNDMKIISEMIPYVVGYHDSPLETSYFTAYGVLNGIREAVKFLYGNEELKNLKVAVQGIGRTGYFLCKQLSNFGAKLFVTDSDLRLVKRIVGECNATVVQIEEIYSIGVDVFAPCALGGIISPHTIDKFNCKIICGSSNNQLQNPSMGKALYDKNILYVPDYVINSGGAISLTYEEEIAKNYPSNAFAHIDKMKLILREIFMRSERERQPTNLIADAIAFSKVNKRTL